MSSSSGPASSSTTAVDSTGGSDIPPEEPFSNGSRLAAQYYNGGRGAVRLDNWVDTTLGMHCTFAHDQSWDIRCMPLAAAQILYADADCTMPIAQLGPCSDVPTYVGQGLADTCPGEVDRRRAYSVGAVTRPALRHYLAPDGECSSGDPPPPDFTYHTLEAVDDAIFVGAALTPYPVGDGLSVTVAEAEDGAYQRMYPQLDAEGLPCFAYPIGGGSRCVPNTITYDSDRYYSDANCTVSNIAYGVSAPECGDTPYALVFTLLGDPCAGIEVALHEVNAMVASAYEDTGVCTEASPATKRTLWEVGAELPDSTLPEITTGLRGTGVVAVQEHATISGELLARSYGFFDQQRQVQCQPNPTSAGLRCLPKLTSVRPQQWYWGDPACSTTPVVALTQSPCGGVAPFAIAEIDDSACISNVTALYELGAIFSGQLYESDRPGECVPIEPGPIHEYIEAGAALDLSGFPALALVEP